MRKSIFTTLFGAALCMTLSGCHGTTPPKPLEMLTPQEQLGRAAFASHCGACHYDRESGSLHGPSLLGVYKKSYLPSGAPANDDRIRNVILHGRGNMPALGGTISDDRIDDILAYLKTL
jgi:mono/diheme cytochrome c family protein